LVFAPQAHIFSRKKSRFNLKKLYFNLDIQMC
jgi:hypothetical protein